MTRDISCNQMRQIAFVCTLEESDTRLIWITVHTASQHGTTWMSVRTLLGELKYGCRSLGFSMELSIPHHHMSLERGMCDPSFPVAAILLFAWLLDTKTLFSPFRCCCHSAICLTIQIPRRRWRYPCFEGSPFVCAWMYRHQDEDDVTHVVSALPSPVIATIRCVPDYRHQDEDDVIHIVSALPSPALLPFSVCLTTQTSRRRWRYPCCDYIHIKTKIPLATLYLLSLPLWLLPIRCEPDYRRQDEDDFIHVVTASLVSDKTRHSWHSGRRNERGVSSQTQMKARSWLSVSAFWVVSNSSRSWTVGRDFTPLIKFQHFVKAYTWCLLVGFNK